MKPSLIFILLINTFVSKAQFEQVIDTNFQVINRFEQIKIIPNSTSEILFIRNGDVVDSYHLLNLQGAIVQKGMGHTQIISLINLPEGDYFLFIEIQGFYKRFRIKKY
jgi:hypothetical protein